MECPTEDVLGAFLSGRLERDDQLALDIEEHLRECSRCAAAVGLGADGSPGDEARDGVATVRPLATGDQLDRYHILRLAGMGAVGYVYEAYDPKLDRRIAVKVLRRADPEMEERLHREARALARVRSPHVVAVHDAGLADGRLYVAMDFIEGTTLREWLTATKRTRDQILEAFLQAGRGLAAAHAAGIVHRDFKPDNVLVRPDGQVMVTDFGLAVGAAAPLTSADSAPVAPATDPHLTSTGALIGTPAYMAPEQLRGERVDARSDVFSFCVALHAALHGHHPFPVASMSALTDAVLHGTIQPGRDPTVPPHLRDAVLAGLAPRPEDRPPSMSALLERLAPRRTHPAPRRATLAFGALSLSLAVAAAVALATRAPAPVERPCQGAARKLAGVWDEPRRAEVTRALAATGSPLGASAASSIARALDDYAARWTAARTDACEATRVRGEQSEVVLDQRIACLDERLLRLGALARSLERVTAAQVSDAAAAPYRLPDVERCADPRALADPPASPVHGPLRVLARATVAGARARSLLGDRPGGLVALAPALSVAAATKDRLLEAEARVLEGQLQFESDPKAAEASFQAGAIAAQAAERPELAALAWLHLARRLGTERAEDALLWSDYALAAAESAGDELLRAEVLLARGVVHMWRHEQKVALGLFREALAIVEVQVGPDHPRVVDALTSLAWALRVSGDPTEALALVTRAAAVNARSFGDTHPATLNLWSEQGCTELELGRNADAMATLGRALAGKERLHGKDDLALASTLNCIALGHHNSGRFRESAETYRRTLAISERAHGERSPRLVYLLGMLARTEALLGDGAAADEAARRALAIAGTLPDDHLLRAVAHLHRGGALQHLDRCKEAIPELEEARRRFLAVPDAAGEIDAAWAMDGAARCRMMLGQRRAAEEIFAAALAVFEKAYGPKHFSVAAVLVGLAELHHGVGDDARAAASAERAVEMLGETAGMDELVGEARFRWAQALWATDRRRALSMGEQARTTVAALADGHPLRRKLDAWLRDHHP